VCSRKPRTLEELKQQIENAAVAVSPETARNMTLCCTLLSTVFTGAGGGHFTGLRV
jgi:hypothetical protein